MPAIPGLGTANGLDIRLQSRQTMDYQKLDYESFIIPIPVLISLSVAVSGAMLGLFFSGMPLSIYSQLGIILLVGMASKNAILIVEFARDERAKGATLVNAVVRGL